MKKERLEIAIKNLHRANINLLRSKKNIKKLNYAATAFDFTKNLRGKIMLKQKRTIADLNEECNDLAIDIEILKNSHQKEVADLLTKIETLERAAKEADEQKGHDLLIEHGGDREIPKVDGLEIDKKLYSKFIENNKRVFLINDTFVRLDFLFLIETSLAIPTGRSARVATLKTYWQDGLRYMVVSDPIND